MRKRYLSSLVIWAVAVMLIASSCGSAVTGGTQEVEATTPSTIAPSATPAPTSTGAPVTAPVEATPAASEPTLPDGWHVYNDDGYGFRIAYPADWTYKPIEQGGPGTPDDWPVQLALSFFPESMREAMNQQGPPDPNAPAVIPPFSLEVCRGSMEQFRRVYPEAGSVEEIELNGAALTIERDTYEDYNVVRYVFTHPEQAEVRVVLSDVISGFSERAKANPEYLDIISRVVATFTFTSTQTISDEDSATQTLSIAEAGISLRVPTDWQRLTAEWVWQPSGDDSQWIGVTWMDLTPPQEAEPALLPNHAQILESKAVELAWGKGRSFKVEVYTPAAQGGDGKANVASVEWHTIIIVEGEGTRRAYDFYVGGKSVEALVAAMPVYRNLLASVSL